MTKASRFNKIAQDISKLTGVGLSDTVRVLNAYVKRLSLDMDIPEQERSELLFGILKVDGHIGLYPGTTVVYSQDDIGKTSFLKTIAMNLVKQGQVVLYIDAECKLYLHQLSNLDGVYFSTVRNIDAVWDFINTGLVDVVLVDTISSMPHNSLKAFLFTARKKVPFIILAAQMRVDFEKRKKIPACSDSILSSSHTHIYLTESEKISFERLDMKRVQFSIMKYEKDHTIAGTRNSFVVSNNMVSNFWSSVDHLHSSGMIRAFGQDKYLDGVRIGKYIDIIENKDIISDLIRMTWSSISTREVDYGIFHEREIPLQWVQAEGSEAERDYISPGEISGSDTDSCGLSDNRG